MSTFIKPKLIAASAGNTCARAPNDQMTALISALLARAGHTVIQGNQGDFTVIRWGISRYCPDFTALQDFAIKVGAIDKEVNHGI